MRYCSKCGRKQMENNLFCTDCGAKLTGSELSSPPADTSYFVSKKYGLSLFFLVCSFLCLFLPGLHIGGEKITFYSFINMVVLKLEVSQAFLWVFLALIIAYIVLAILLANIVVTNKSPGTDGVHVFSSVLFFYLLFCEISIFSLPGSIDGMREINDILDIFGPEIGSILMPILMIASCICMYIREPEHK